jgi:hypothetical protein
MANADYDNYIPPEPVHHVENADSIGQKVNRKKDQQQKKNRKKKHPEKPPIDQQLEEEKEQLEQQEPAENGSSGQSHIDFHA